MFAFEILNIDLIALFKLMKTFIIKTFKYMSSVLLHKINLSGTQTLIN